MEELSLHIMDIVENSLEAGARTVQVEIAEDPGRDRLTISIDDDGRGMSAQTAAQAPDPFFTTRDTRPVGLGLSLLQARARACAGDLELESRPGAGTRVRAWFQLSHIDRQPLGDWPGSLAGLILSHPEVELSYRHRVGEECFELDTRELKAELGAEGLRDPSVVAYLRRQVARALAEMGSGA